LVQGLAGAYKFKRVQVSGDERYHEKPDKTKESHIVEALHYGLMGAGEGHAVLSTGEPRQYRVKTNTKGIKTVGTKPMTRLKSGSVCFR